MDKQPMPPEDFRTSRIRLFNDADAERVSAIIRNGLTESNSKDYPPEVIEHMSAFWTPEKVCEMAAGRTIYVLEEGNEVVGTVSTDDEKIFTMFVDPNVHGQGIGTKLMDHAEKAIQMEGHSRVELASSITAHDFYKARGYVDIRETESDEDGLGYLMQKSLL